ncbi:MAG: insulinase family protein, partial [Myxococcales bacterium]|nr:insulinase family protein [Myxococcales bacterium]
AAPAPAEEAPAASAPAKPAQTASASSTSTSAKPGALPAIAADQALEVVLDCGLRVLIARDRTLPVAAVILAVESGPEDDPEDAPGLTHALAYYLLYGNRELRPGESIDTVHAGGGVSSMAVGLAQVRYESVVPASRLEEVLWIESQRLRSPTVQADAWKKALRDAAGDAPRQGILPPPGLAAVHRQESLGHSGRRPGPNLAGLNEGALSSHLRARFNYARATLVVVAPEDPRELLGAVERLFGDLPAAKRQVPARLPGLRSAAAKERDKENAATLDEATTPDAVPPDAGASPEGAEGTGDAVGGADDPKPEAATSPAPATPEVDPAAGAGLSVDPDDLDPEVIEAGHHKLPLYAWSIPGTPAANAWAIAVCRALNGQRRRGDESKRMRVSCAVDHDPRRGSLLIQILDADAPLEALRSRFARLASGRDRALLRAQAVKLGRELDFASHRPLTLARQLAVSTEDEAGPRPTARALADLTGLAALSDVDRLSEHFPAMLHLRDAITLVRPETSGKGKPVKGQGPAKGKPTGKPADAKGGTP